MGLALLLSPASLPGQQPLPAPSTTPPSSARVLLESKPNLARVELAGGVRIHGQTPFQSSDTPPGVYRLTVLKKGYEPDQARVVLRAGQSITLTTELRPKLRWNAGARSLFFPGFGQRYAEYRGKGWVLTLTEVAGLGTMWFLNSNYQDALEDYRLARSRYQQATGITDIDYYRQQMVDDFHQADNYHKYLSLTTYAVVGVWGYNVLDALIFAPATDEGFSVGLVPGHTPRLAACFDKGDPGVGLEFAF